MRSLLGHQAHVLASSSRHLFQMSLLAQPRLVLHLSIESIHIQRQTTLLTHELGQIHGKSHGRVQKVRIASRKHLVRSQRIAPLLELHNAPIDRPRKILLLLPYNHGYVLFLLPQFREGVPHELHERSHELGEEPQFRVEVLSTVSDRAAQHSSEDVTSPVLVGDGAVGDGEAQRAHVVGHDPIGHVDVVRVLAPDLAGVRPRPGNLLNGVE
mmetsp:Transcript_9242/g.19502  ORF Transcript_9242/g.19502 Transcript_9242/m.19502 type:complete len:212 (-) Transcript_9242:951-1586(-)